MLTERPTQRLGGRETIIAVNFGRCVIPTGLAVYELLQLAAQGAPALWSVLAPFVTSWTTLPAPCFRNAAT